MHVMIKADCLLLFCCLLSCGLSAQTEFITFAEEDGSILSIAEKMDKETVNGFSLAIYRQMELDTLVQYGYRDEAQQLPVDEHTVFQVGSMGTAVVHFAVIRTAEAGLIDLDEDVNTYLKSWKLPVNKFNREQAVTIRDLLLRSRGFRDEYKPKGYTAGTALPNLVQILKGQAPSQEKSIRLVRKEAGENTTFQNGLVLQQLLIDVYQKPFAELMQEVALRPLGMEDSFFATELSPAQAANAALGYYRDGAAVPGGYYRYPELAAAGLWCTPADYAKLVQTILQAATGKDTRLISRELARQCIDPVYQGRSLIFHSGKTLFWGGAPQGYYSIFYADPEAGWIAVGMSNSHINWQFVNTAVGKGGDYAYRKDQRQKDNTK